MVNGDHDISRRKRGMFDKFMARDPDGDGDMDFIGTAANTLMTVCSG